MCVLVSFVLTSVVSIAENSKRNLMQHKAQFMIT